MRPSHSLRFLTPVLLGVGGCTAISGPRSPSGPPPDLVVGRVTDMGTVPAGPQVSGRDGGYSGVFQGQSVWLYSDTFLGHPNAENASLISDSWAWTGDLNAADGITGFQQRDDPSGDPAMFLTETPAERQFNAEHSDSACQGQAQTCSARWALWLASIVPDSVHNHALIFYNLVHAADGDYNFYRVGTSVATWVGLDQSPQRPTINASAEHPDLLFNQDEPDFGGAALIDGGLLYAYSCGNANKSCLLGRVDPARVLDRSAWTYYAGGGTWSATVSAAASLFAGNDIINVSWNAYLQRYVAIYSYPLSTNVMVRTAPRPEGPWSGETQIFTAMTPVGGGTVYDAQSHPEFNGGGGQTMYVSYSRGTGDFISEIRLVSVEFGRP